MTTELNHNAAAVPPGNGFQLALHSLPLTTNTPAVTGATDAHPAVGGWESLPETPFRSEAVRAKAPLGADGYSHVTFSIATELLLRAIFLVTVLQKRKSFQNSVCVCVNSNTETLSSSVSSTLL